MFNDLVWRVSFWSESNKIVFVKYEFCSFSIMFLIFELDSASSKTHREPKILMFDGDTKDLKKNLLYFVQIMSKKPKFFE